MASMKDRVIAHITEVLSFYNDDSAFEKTCDRLHELGAPESLVAGSIDRRAAMRRELPRLIAFLGTLPASTSLKAMLARAGQEGFTGEALYAISPV